MNRPYDLKGGSSHYRTKRKVHFSINVSVKLISDEKFSYAKEPRIRRDSLRLKKA